MSVPSIIPKIMAAREVIPFLYNAARKGLKVDVNRRCVALALHPGTTVDVDTYHINGPADLQNFNDTVDANVSSVVISWPDDTIASPQTNDFIRDVERILRESHQDVTTTKPFFVLDGGGLRKASLSLLENPDPKTSLDQIYSSSVESYSEVPETWLRHYCSLRSISP